MADLPVPDKRFTIPEVEEQGESNTAKDRAAPTAYHNHEIRAAMYGRRPSHVGLEDSRAMANATTGNCGNTRPGEQGTQGMSHLRESVAEPVMSRAYLNP